MKKSTNKKYLVINSKPYIKLFNDELEEIGVYDYNGDYINEEEYKKLKESYIEFDYEDYASFLNHYNYSYNNAKKQRNRCVYRPFEVLGESLLAVLALEGLTGGMAYLAEKCLKVDTSSFVTFITFIYVYSALKTVSEELKHEKDNKKNNKRIIENYNKIKKYLRVVKKLDFDVSELIEQINNGEIQEHINYSKLKCR